MIAIVVAVILVISLGITVFLGAYVALNCESTKKNYFLLLIYAVFLFVLGYLLEITAGDSDGGLAATKVMYMGSTFVAPLFTLFAADYCEINIKKFYIIAPLILVPILVNIMVWTVPYNTLLYSSYEYMPEAIVPHLAITKGSLYYLNHAFSLLCIAASTAMIVNRMIKWDKRYRFQLTFMLVGSLTPLIANLLFVVGLKIYGINYTPVSLVAFNIIYYFMIVRYDIFDLLPKASEMALRSIREAYILIDSEMNFLNANPSAYAIFPELKKLRKGSNLAQISTWPKEMRTLGPDQVRREIKFSQYEDESKFYNASVNPVFLNKKAMGWVLLIQDVTSAHLLNMELKERASLDALTGIYNRRHFMEIIDLHIFKAHRTRTTCYILMLDIDHFKNVNDTYGHQAGDQVLVTFASTIKQAIRSYDIFARYGGEEFVVYLEGDRTTAAMLSERIRQAVAEKKCVYGINEIYITVSIGAAAIDEGMTIDNAINLADMAMYRAKSSGRNNIVFFEDMQ